MIETISPNTSIGQYSIASKIGEGGMGEVYLAEDTRLHRKVALKILPADLASNQDRMRRFEQESKIRQPALGCALCRSRPAGRVAAVSLTAVDSTKR